MTKKTVENMRTELNLPAPDKPASEWTRDECIGVATGAMLIIKHLDLDIDETTTLKEITTAGVKAMNEDRMPDEFYDEVIRLADQRRGGRIQ